jgi:4-hydroxybenzoate polyprenyltransferase
MIEAGKLKKLRSTALFNNRSFLAGFFQMARLHTGVQAAAYLLLSMYLTNHQMQVSGSRVVMGGSVIIFTVAFGFVVDDIRDLAIDRIAKPNNAIPAGRISHRGAILLAILFAVGSIFGAGILGRFFLVLTSVNLLICLSYAYVLRNIAVLSIFIIAYLNGSIVIFGGALAGGLTVLTGFVFLLIFLFTCAQETLYAVVDHDADQMYNVPSSATILGINNSLRLSVFFLLLAIMVTIYLGIAVPVSPSFRLLMVPCIILPLASALTMIIKSSSNHSVKHAIKILYFTRFLSFIALWSL